MRIMSTLSDSLPSPEQERVEALVEKGAAAKALGRMVKAGTKTRGRIDTEKRIEALLVDMSKRSVEMMLAYVDGRPMPCSSSDFTRLASV